MLRKTFPLPARILITPSFNHVVGALLNHTEQDRDVSTNTLELNIFKYRCGATLDHPKCNIHGGERQNILLSKQKLTRIVPDTYNIIQLSKPCEGRDFEKGLAKILSMVISGYWDLTYCIELS